MITAVPSFLAVTSPLVALTVATPVELLVNFMLYDAVPLGNVGFRSKVSPTPRVTAVLLSVTFVGAFFTVTVQVAFLPL